MNWKLFGAGIVAAAAALALFQGEVAGARPRTRMYGSLPARSLLSPKTRQRISGWSTPTIFEPNQGQFDPRVRFVARWPRLTALFTRQEIDLVVGAPSHAGRATRPLRMQFLNARPLAWVGVGKLRSESNYFVRRDRAHWKTRVPNFLQAQASLILPGVDALFYGNSEGIEYDLRFAPGAEPSRLGLRISGAERISIAANGDLLLRLRDGELRMKAPHIYEERDAANPDAPAEFTTAPFQPTAEKHIAGGYLLHSDGTVGFRVGPHDPNATVVIDPSLSVEYATFLGGAGSESSTSLALDSSGDLYVAGTTASADFPETASTVLGPGVSSGLGTTQFFIAKIDPSVSGPNSLLYLTFLGGTGVQSGGSITLDTLDDIYITGTTTSTDFPVTDGTQRTAGLDNIAVSEIDPTGSQLLFSTLFGGSGIESQYSSGGIAVDASGNILISSDTSSTDLPVTTGALQTTFGGTTSDGFLAIFSPTAMPDLTYCTYLGTNATAQIGVGGIAVDSSGDAYIAGFSSNATSGFPVQSALQSAYGGGATDAFLMKISPLGQGSADLIYATLLGGAGADQALAVAVDSATPPKAYITGSTQSADFPVNGGTSAYQPSLHSNATANAFLSVIGQNGTTGDTYLAYSTYLGGSGTDTSQAIAAVALNAIYIGGTTTSFDFPWLNNFQPYNGSGDAFVAKFDATQPGTASLQYATPLGGTASLGQIVMTSAGGIAADGAGHAYVAGQSSAADFPTVVSTSDTMNGFQPICSSCQGSAPQSDAFVVEIQESRALLPSVYFNLPHVAFGAEPIGTQNAPAPVAVHNGGESPLTITDLTIAGPNAGDFSLVGGNACKIQSVSPEGECSFEIGFVPSTIGAEAATLTVSDNAPGSPQVLELVGQGQGPLASVSPLSINFGNVPSGGPATLGQTITISNVGNQPLAIASITESGPDIAQFPVNNANNTCKSILPAGQSCTTQAFFQPSSPGRYHAEINIVDNSGTVQNATQIVTLTGTGTAPAPIANIAPATLTFGTQTIGAAPTAQPVTLTNQGSLPLTLSGISIVGANSADFGILHAASNSCPASGGTLAEGSSCTVSVQFAPQSAGSKSASLSFADNAPGSPQLISLSGSAVAAQVVQISPSSLTFAAQSVGIASAPQAITVSNTGGSPLAINGVAVSGANAGDFLQTNNCPPSLGAEASCLINIVFQPLLAAATNRAATVTIADNALGSPQMVPVSGIATQPALAISPTSINFGGQLAGTPGSPQTVTALNNGTGALAFSGIHISGTNAADFTIGANICSGTSTPPGGNCTIQITFSPSCLIGSANRTASLQLTDNAAGSPQSVALSGMATGDFCFDPPTQGATTVTVTAGQTATYSLALNSPSAYSGMISLACSGAPSASTCTVNPATVTLPAQFSVTVSTTANAIASPPSGAFRRPDGTSAANLLWRLLVFAAGLLCMATWLANGYRRLAANLVLVAALAFLTGLAGCGSSGANATVSGTPPGTYTFALTGTASDNTSRSLNLTLIVQ